MPSAADALLAAGFWASVGGVGYSFVLYPLLLGAIARRRGRPAWSAAQGEPPPVGVVVAAYNEQDHIEARIHNLLAQRYPADRLRVYVGSDGSADATVERARRVGDPRVSVVDFPHNRGKASVLNDLVAMAREPLLVLTDANTVFDADAVARLVAPFADPAVGCVCGELDLVDASGSNRDSAYWRWERRLKQDEASIGGLLGANGGIYAIRRELYRPLAADTITDDFCIGMAIRAAGRLLVYEPRAQAREDTPDDMADEYVRRVRIGIGNYQSLFRHPEFLLRTGWATAWTYASHKVLRWLTPHLMLCALACAALLAPRSPFYAALAAAQALAYAAAPLLYRARRRLPRMLGLPLMFLAMNWAFAVAFVRYLRGDYRGSWRRTARAAAP